MRYLIYFFILIAINIQLVIAQQYCIGQGELIFYNYYADGVTVRVIPEGTIFSGHTDYNTPEKHEYKYSLRPCYRTTDAGTNWIHVVGGSRTMPLMPTVWPPNCLSQGYAVFDWDDGANNNAYGHPEVCAGAVSYGLWRVEFWYLPSDESQPEQLNSCKIDYRDWRAPKGCNFNNHNDLFVQLSSDNNIYFYWTNGFDQEPLEGWVSITNPNVPDRTIQWFRQIRPDGTILECPGGQDKGNFLTSSTDGGYWLNFPIDAHDLNSYYIHMNPEYLNMNLSVASGHHAKIKSNKTLYIENGATLNLLSGSTLQFLANSTLYVKKGGKFCNYGGQIIDPHIIYEKRGVYTYCNYYNGEVTSIL